MILEELVVHNFGVFRGRQQILLAPTSAKTPIVLVGGLNGGGKTTLLDAIHLALYGRRARCSNRGSLPYDEYLRRSIHRGVDPADGAAVELQFRRWEENQVHTYRVHRSWHANGKGLRERVEVLRDDKQDALLTESWDEHVEEVFPHGLSSLFLFDGEKIEELANTDKSTQLLDTAIRQLLGLGIVDQLAADLNVLERRKRTALKSDFDRDLILAAEKECARLLEHRQEMLQRRAAGQTDLDQKVKRQKESEQLLRNQGGDLFENRERVAGEREAVQKRLLELEDELREIASGPIPLLLIRDLVESLHANANTEASAEHSRLINTLLAERDRALLAFVAAEAQPDLVPRIQQFLDQDRSARTPQTCANPYLELDAGARNSVDSLLAGGFAEATERAKRLLATADEARSRLAELDRMLAAVPDRDAIAQLVKTAEEARIAAETAKARLADLDRELDDASRRVLTAESALASKIGAAVEEDFRHEEDTRVIRHSGVVRTTLDKFRQELVVRHMGRIEKLVADSYGQLLRKKSLLTGLRIDPETMQVRLAGRDGKHLPPERLSAGERQLLAVSLLWGLARASGRPLPTVIDTPLGRLDSQHRFHLIERYFPNASHQVLLLSTDEEIDEKNFAKLKRWVGRTYQLEYDDKNGGTTIREGYFW